MNQITDAEVLQQEQINIIDLRQATDFVDGFLQRSIYLAPDEYFSQLIDAFANPAWPVILVGEKADCIAAAKKVKDAGFDQILGYILPGIDYWKKNGFAVDLIIAVDAYELALDLPNDDNLLLIDVRTMLEFDQQHIDDARNLPLADFTDIAQIATLPEDANLYFYCSNGNRSATACSILRMHGYPNIRWVDGGMQEMVQQDGLPVKASKAKLN